MRRPDRLAGLSSAWDAAKSSRRVLSPARAWGINLRRQYDLQPAGDRKLPLQPNFLCWTWNPGDRGASSIHNISQKQAWGSRERLTLLFGNLHPAHRKETPSGTGDGKIEVKPRLQARWQEVRVDAQRTQTRGRLFASTEIEVNSLHG